MLNLSLATCTVSFTTLGDSNIYGIALDTDRNGLWIVTSSRTLYFLSSTPQEGTSNDRDSHVTSLSDHMTDEDRPIGMEYLSEMGVVCIASQQGEVITCNTNSYEVETVGSVTDGITAMGWSPDQDLVAMVTSVGNLLLMTREFDALLEVPIFTDEFGEAQPVNVGWGKKETQFHGSLGKPSKQLPPQQVSSGPLSWDDGRPRISWRGDGEYFVISFINPSTNSRSLRIWTRDGSLHSTSEITNGLSHALNWRPRGNLIAASQLKPQSHDIIFFERNGLRHGEFPLRGNKDEWSVRELFWNADSAVLGVWLESLVNDSNTKTKVQLWSSSNYYWYLKQEFYPTQATPTKDTPTKDTPIKDALTSDTPTKDTPTLVAIQWDPIDVLKLHLFLSNGQYLVYEWKWCVASNLSLHEDNNSTVPVIDGMSLHVTPLQRGIVPPPMSMYQVAMTSPVVMVTFSPPPNPNDFIVLLSNGQLVICRSDERGLPKISMMLPFGGVADDSVTFSLHNLRHILWIDQYTLLGVTCQSCDNYEDFIVKLELPANEKTTDITVKNSFSCGGHVLCLIDNPDSKSVAFELKDGKVFRYSNGGCSPWLTATGDHVTMSGLSCDQLVLATMGDEECVIGLCTRRHQLIINNTVISSSCTSFTVTDQFLLFTTNTHHLYCLSRCVKYLNGSSSLEGAEFRSIERGALIRVALVNDTRVVLQMPRGNLETISPRPLILNLIRKHLDKLEFDKAFLIMRKHRINLNLLCDHNMESFLSHTSLFVEQLREIHYLNLFLTELRDENVTQSLYPVPHWYGSESVRHESESNKVNTVCDAVIGALSGDDEKRKRLALSVITAHIRKVPQELEKVLETIRDLQNSPPEGCPTVDEALKYTTVLVDVNELYNTALGMYDFNLVLTVAERSQKDPKEYLPFLNELKSLPEHYQHYRINMHLSRYDKALKDISHCCPDKFEECIQLIKNHKLYKLALKIFTDRGSHECHVISRLYGDHLTEKGNYKEAAIIYESCDELELALSSFEKGGLWEYVFITSQRLKHSEEITQKLAKKIASQLKGQSRYEAAAKVLIDYAKDIEGGIETLVAGNMWAESQRYVYLYNRIDLLEGLVKPALVESHKSILLLLETQLELFSRHSKRLLIVREEKEKKREAMLDGTYTVDEKEGDIFSDTSTVTGASVTTSQVSRGTRTSAKSAKNRRKAERKKHSLKEGSRYEDIALMEALKEIVTLCNTLQDDVSSLLIGLCLFGFTEESSYLQEKFKIFKETISTHLPLLWPPPSPPSSEQSDLPTDTITTGPQSTVNSIIASMKSQHTSSVETVPVAPVLNISASWMLSNL